MLISSNASVKNLSNLLNTLSSARNEIALQAHLLNMDLKLTWEKLENRIQNMEYRLQNQLTLTAKGVGQKEQQFFVGNQNEINSLVSEINALKAAKKHQKNQ